jgi:hypothetical protein
VPSLPTEFHCGVPLGLDPDSGPAEVHLKARQLDFQKGRAAERGMRHSSPTMDEHVIDTIIRVRLEHPAGQLGSLATTIADIGALIGEITDPSARPRRPSCATTSWLRWTMNRRSGFVAAITSGGLGSKLRCSAISQIPVPSHSTLSSRRDGRTGSSTAVARSLVARAMVLGKRTPGGRITARMSPRRPALRNVFGIS